jgi:hypothetical protein
MRSVEPGAGRPLAEPKDEGPHAVICARAVGKLAVLLRWQPFDKQQEVAS